MHEGFITQLILSKALEKAKEANAKRIIQIDIVFGDTWRVVDQFVESYFSFLSKDTIAAGASLSFQRTPTTLRCRNCDHIYSPKSLDWTCPNCHKKKIEIVSGRECHIESMEVE